MAGRKKFVVSNNEAVGKIRNQEPFRNQSGSLRGGEADAASFGRLPERFREEAGEAAYVIHSYETPIAWITGGGERVVPDIGYSPTTSDHQYVVQSAWLEAGWRDRRRRPFRGREVRPAGGGPRSGGMDG